MITFSLGHYHLRLQFLWYDCWVGAFWDRVKTLYVCPAPLRVLKLWRKE